MLNIRPLDHFHPERFQAIASGYSTNEIYRVTRVEGNDHTTFNLKLETLHETREFRFPYSAEELQRYETIVPGEFCFGAYDQDNLVGIVLAETHEWNHTLWVWEFHVTESCRGQGVGRALMAALFERAELTPHLRAIVCETQNTNLPAIRFYRAVGFTIEGVDISYYTNEDMLPGHTVAVFMKRRLL